MKSRHRLLLLVVLIGVLATTTAALAGTVSWGSAIEVPGIAALNNGGDSFVTALSCAGARNCSAVGVYSNGSGAFVVSEQDGNWGTATEAPGTAALNAGDGISLGPLSCSAPGDCVAAGDAPTTHNSSAGFVDLQHAFLVEQTNGVWSSPITVPGLAALDLGNDSGVNSISCVSPGNCVVAGFFAHSADVNGVPGEFGAFLLSENGGVWGSPFVVFDSEVDGVSCTASGDCVAVGSKHGRAFVLTETSGHWVSKLKVPGVAALSAGGSSRVTSVSCPSAGDCAAGGTYRYGADGARDRAFVVTERNGKWGKAIAVLAGDPAWVTVSCGTPGNCAAGGYYLKGGSRTLRAFVMAEKNHRWSRVIKVPGLANRPAGLDSYVQAVSCAPAGGCAATGSYTDGNFRNQGFVVAETDGKWGKWVEVPGSEALAENEQPLAISCAGAGSCAIGGATYDDSSNVRPFVTAP